MTIQRISAEEQGIDFLCCFLNIAESAEEARLGMKSPFICTDEDRVMQVLLGLQSNAIKFTQEGKIQIDVEIIIKENKEFLQVSVIDTGIGIPKQD